MERIFIAWESQVEMIEGGWFCTIIQLSVKLQVPSPVQDLDQTTHLASSIRAKSTFEL